MHPLAHRRWGRTHWLISLVVVAGALMGAPVVPPLQAQGPTQIGLVVQHRDGRTVTRCVTSDRPELTGYDVLQASGLELSVEPNGMGMGICLIDGAGCRVPQQSCFCGENGDLSVYWSYWQQRDGAWTYSQMGAANTVLRHGAVEGWAWGPGTVNAAPPPPLIPFADICAQATATPTPTITPLPTATDAPTPTPTVTATPAPTLPPTPTWIPTWTPTFVPPTWTPTWTRCSANCARSAGCRC